MLWSNVGKANSVVLWWYFGGLGSITHQYLGSILVVCTTHRKMCGWFMYYCFTLKFHQQWDVRMFLLPDTTQVQRGTPINTQTS